jgi:hypothetical protein
MTKLEALIQLRDKVKAGEAPHTYTMESMFDEDTAYTIKRSYHGSLDAAEALHEAVLPGHFVNMRFWTSSPTMANVEVGNEHEGSAPTPARAWLLAILEALISQEQQ